MAIDGNDAARRERTWASRWLRDITERFGVDLGNGYVQIVTSKAALATLEGCAKSTISARLRRLKEWGLLETVAPMVVSAQFATPNATLGQPRNATLSFPPSDVWPDGQPGSDPAGPATSRSAGLERVLEELGDIAGRLGELATNPDCPIGVLGLIERVAVLARDAASHDASADTGKRASRASDAQDTRFVASCASQEVGRKVETTQTSLPDEELSASQARKTRVAAPATPRTRDTADYEHLLEPLLAAIRRVGGPGITNPDGLARLDHRSDEDLSRAAEWLTRRVVLGDGLTNPIGLLIARANDEDWWLQARQMKEPQSRWRDIATEVTL